MFWITCIYSTCQERKSFETHILKWMFLGDMFEEMICFALCTFTDGSEDISEFKRKIKASVF